MNSAPVTTPGGSGSLLRFARNAGSVLASDVFYRATTFALYLLVARYLGAFEFGQLSLALTLFYTFQVVAVAGLKTLIIREIAKDPTTTDRYLINGSAVVLAASLFAIAALTAFVWLMGYARETSVVILLLSLGLVPFALTAVCEAIFQAWERMHYIAYAHIPANIAKLALAFLLLTQGYHVPHIILLIVISLTLTAGSAWWLMLRHISRPRLSLDIGFAWTMIRATVPFLGIDVVIALWSSLQVILLSILANEIEVGLFSAALQLTVPIMLVFQSISASVFPAMCSRFNLGFQELRTFTENLLEVLLIVALPTATGIFFLAQPLLRLLYGNEGFAPTASALRILTWILIFHALTHALGKVLLAGLKEKTTLRIVFVNTLLSLVLGILLIRQFGLMGAAATKFITGFANVVQHYIPVAKLLPGMSLFKLSWKPLAACLIMASYLTLANDNHLFATIFVAAAIYAFALLALEICSLGGLPQFKVKYRFLWNKGGV